MMQCFSTEDGALKGILNFGMLEINFGMLEMAELVPIVLNCGKVLHN